MEDREILEKLIGFLEEEGDENWQKYCQAIINVQIENENLKQAIKINQDLYETKCNENKELEKRISDLEFSLMDMVLQFADENKNSINTMGLSALEIAFGELDFNNPMTLKEVHKRYKKLAQEYYKVEKEGVKDENI